MGAERIPFTQSGNDLYARVQCTCPSKLFADKPELSFMKTNILLAGYADANFFDKVNAEAQRRACGCGRAYRVQWFRDGVEVQFEEAA